MTTESDTDNVEVASTDAIEQATVETEYGERTVMQATEHVSEGDTVRLQFDNRFDKRFSDKSEFVGTVTQYDTSPSKKGGVVVLTVEDDDGDEAHVLSRFEIGIKRNGRPFNSVGELTAATIEASDNAD